MVRVVKPALRVGRRRFMVDCSSDPVLRKHGGPSGQRSDAALVGEAWQPTLASTPLGLFPSDSVARQGLALALVFRQLPRLVSFVRMRPPLLMQAELQSCRATESDTPPPRHHTLTANTLGFHESLDWLLCSAPSAGFLDGMNEWSMGVLLLRPRTPVLRVLCCTVRKCVWFASQARRYASCNIIPSPFST